MIDHEPIRIRFLTLAPHLDERGLRMFAAAEAKAAGYGGIAAVARAIGIAPSTIGRGLDDLAAGMGAATGQARRPGGGRKSLTEPCIANSIPIVTKRVSSSPTRKPPSRSPVRNHGEWNYTISPNNQSHRAVNS